MKRKKLSSASPTRSASDRKVFKVNPLQLRGLNAMTCDVQRLLSFAATVETTSELTRASQRETMLLFRVNHNVAIRLRRRDDIRMSELRNLKSINAICNCR